MRPWSEIGTPGAATDFGYPASGSFVEYLLDRAGADTFEKLSRASGVSDSKKETSHLWSDLYGASLSDLETAWMSWLADRLR